jgi:hypothetical protein
MIGECRMRHATEWLNSFVTVNRIECPDILSRAALLAKGGYFNLQSPPVMHHAWASHLFCEQNWHELSSLGVKKCPIADFGLNVATAVCKDLEAGCG